jgi:hypothetical protein
VKKAPYLRHPQNDADIRVTELKFSLEAILRAPLQLPAAFVGADLMRKSLA